jgi:lipid-A-disaccharide synthase
VPPEEYARATSAGGRHGIPIDLREGPAASIITGSDFLLVTSGTATLESALLGTPLAVLYRTSPVTWFIGRRLVRIPRISLVNIVAEEDLVAEFLQGEARPTAIADHVEPYLTDPARRRELSARLLALRDKLGSPGTADRAADRVLEEARR